MSDFDALALQQAFADLVAASVHDVEVSIDEESGVVTVVIGGSTEAEALEHLARLTELRDDIGAATDALGVEIEEISTPVIEVVWVAPPTSPPPVAPSCDVPMMLTAPASAGTNMLEITTPPSCVRVGMPLVLCRGCQTEEEVTVAGFGSIITAEPLMYNHSAGEQLVVVFVAIGGEASANTSSGPGWYPWLALPGSVLLIALAAAFIVARRRREGSSAADPADVKHWRGHGSRVEMRFSESSKSKTAMKTKAASPSNFPQPLSSRPQGSVFQPAGSDADLLEAMRMAAIATDAGRRPPQRGLPRIGHESSSRAVAQRARGAVAALPLDARRNMAFIPRSTRDLLAAVDAAGEEPATPRSAAERAAATGERGPMYVAHL